MKDGVTSVEGAAANLLATPNGVVVPSAAFLAPENISAEPLF